MAKPPNTFFWYELITDDPAAATSFYENVVGWRPEPFPGSDDGYMVMHARDGGAERGVAGIMEIPAEARQRGAPPSWTGYIHVDDVDRAAGDIEAAGGAVHKAPADIPGVGRFAVVTDPQGAHFIIMKPAMNGSGEGQGPAPMAPGFVGWNELMTSDWEKGFAFYSRLFGWSKDQAIPMGEMGTYQLFAAGEGDAIGGMMNKLPEMPVSAWGFYFIVPAMDAAMERVRAAGGKVLTEMEVPGGAWAANVVDPQGAVFGLTAARR